MSDIDGENLLCPPPGIYPSVPFETYASWNAINSGAVSAMMLSPKHGRMYLEGGLERKDSDSMRFGRQLHLMLLEPEIAAVNLIVSEPCSGLLASGSRKGEICGSTASYTNGIDWRCGQHLTPDYEKSTDHLSKAEHERALQMIDSLRSSAANKLFRKSGWCESSIVYEWNGVTLKGRLDRLSDDRDLIIDLKKIRVGYGSIARAQKMVVDYGYHRQAAIYATGIAVLEKRSMPTFAWVMLEDGPPYDVQVVIADTSDLQIGWSEVEAAIESYRKCEAAGEFTGYVKDATSIPVGALPEYYKKKFERSQNGTEDTYGDVSGNRRNDSGDEPDTVDQPYGLAAATGGDDEWSRYVAENT